jgi:hypothetical protein
MAKDKIAFICAALREMVTTGIPVEAGEMRGLLAILNDVWSDLTEVPV